MSVISYHCTWCAKYCSVHDKKVVYSDYFKMLVWCDEICFDRWRNVLFANLKLKFRRNEFSSIYDVLDFITSQTAPLAKQVDASDLKSEASGRAGSSPAGGTNFSYPKTKYVPGLGAVVPARRCEYYKKSSTHHDMYCTRDVCIELNRCGYPNGAPMRMSHNDDYVKSPTEICGELTDGA